MVMSLASIEVRTKPVPPRIVIHGTHGVGKTTLGAEATGPVFIPTEDGLGTLRVPAFPLAKSYGDVLDALRALYAGEHEFRTVIIDSLDWLEPLIWQVVAFEGGKQDIEEFGFGKGYVKADEKWTQLLNALTLLRDKRQMTIVLLAHTEIKRYDAPDSAPYDRFGLKLHKRAAALVDEWADIIGFAHFDVRTETTDVGFNRKVTRGVGNGDRVLALEQRPAFDAKNRYGLPSEIPLEWQALRDALRVAFSPPAPVSSETTPAADPPAASEPETNGAQASSEEPAYV